jgi:hypothetical protein
LTGDRIGAIGSLFTGIRTAVKGPELEKRNRELKSSMGDVISFSGYEHTRWPLTCLSSE